MKIDSISSFFEFQAGYNYAKHEKEIPKYLKPLVFALLLFYCSPEGIAMIDMINNPEKYRLNHPDCPSCFCKESVRHQGQGEGYYKCKKCLKIFFKDEIGTLKEYPKIKKTKKSAEKLIEEKLGFLLEEVSE